MCKWQPNWIYENSLRKSFRDVTHVQHKILSILFSLSPTLLQDKLECLPLTIFRFRPMVVRKAGVEHLTAPIYNFRLLALLANLILYWKNLRGINALAHFVELTVTKKKRLVPFQYKGAFTWSKYCRENANDRLLSCLALTLAPWALKVHLHVILISH